MATLKRISVQKTRLADEIYEQLLIAIGAGDIAPNERLVQERLANELQVSRTPVREALLRLEQEGVLETSGRSGFVIRQISNAEVREIYQARIAIEGFAARLVTERNDKAVYEQLRNLVLQQESIKRVDISAYFEANRTIHRAIVEKANNRFLLEQFDSIWNRSNSFRMFAKIDDVDLDKSLGDHIPLIDAMASGNGHDAFEAMRDHIEGGLTLQMDAILNS